MGAPGENIMVKPQNDPVKFISAIIIKCNRFASGYSLRVGIEIGINRVIGF